MLKFVANRITLTSFRLSYLSCRNAALIAVDWSSARHDGLLVLCLFFALFRFLYLVLASVSRCVSDFGLLRFVYACERPRHRPMFKCLPF